MAIVDSAPEGGKFRAFAAAALDGVSGAFGRGDLLCVALNASGELVVGTATTAIGVILTSEGKRDNTHANFKKVVGGVPYTVLRRAILSECDQWASPTAVAGDTYYATAAGDVTKTIATAAVRIGHVVKGDGTGGTKFVLDIGGAAPAGVVDAHLLEFAAANGAVAGNVTAAGIAVGDSLLAVLVLSKAVIVNTVIAGAAAGNHVVTGIVTTDTLISVIEYGAALATLVDATADYTISAADTINNAAKTSSAGGFLGVTYRRNLTSDEITNLTSEFAITAPDTINNGGGTSTAGKELIVVWATP